MFKFLKKVFVSLFLILSFVNSYGFAADSGRDMNQFPDIVATYCIKDYSPDGIITLFTRIGGNTAAFVVHPDDIETLYQYKWRADSINGGDNLWLKRSNDQNYPYLIENNIGEKIRVQFHRLTTDFLSAQYNKVKKIRYSFFDSEILIDYYDLIGQGIVWSVSGISYFNPELYKDDVVIFGIEEDKNVGFNLFIINCNDFKTSKAKFSRYVKKVTDF